MRKKTPVNASADPAPPITPKRSPIQEVTTPQITGDSPPPPPPIEKSPGMRVKGDQRRKDPRNTEIKIRYRW